jgi:hypothetical protein
MFMDYLFNEMVFHKGDVFFLSTYHDFVRLGLNNT